MLPIPLLESERLKLRAYRATDVDGLYAIYCDPRVMRYWSYPAWTERTQAEEYLARVRRERKMNALYPWAVVQKNNDQLIGTCTLFHLRKEHGCTALGYALAHDYWGQGYGSEVVSCVLGYAFDTLKLHRVEVDIDPRNTASCRLVEKFGFRREGLLRACYRVAGEVQDAVLYGLLADEYVRK